MGSTSPRRWLRSGRISNTSSCFEFEVEKISGVKVSRWAAAIALAFTTLLLAPTFASAHAQLVSTYPEANSTLAKAPTKITLTWGEKVDTNANQILLADSTGKEVATKYLFYFNPKSSQSTSTLTPIDTLPSGSYIVSWRAVSRDGHLVGGAYSFGVNQAPSATSNSSLISYPDKVLQFIFWALLILAFGSVMAGVFTIFIPTAFLVILISALRLMVISSILPDAYLQSGVAKISFVAIASFTLLLGLSASSIFKPRHRGSSQGLVPLDLLRLLIIVLVFSSQELVEGHALDLAHPAALKFIAAGHLFCAITWSGSVVALFLKGTREQFEITRRVSTVSIALLIPLAIILTWFLATPLNFTSVNEWTLFLFIKLIFIAATIGIGAFHHFAGRRAAQSANFELKRTLKIELGTIAAILIATVVLVSFTPPKILAQDRQTPSVAPGAELAQRNYLLPLTFDNGLKGTLKMENLQLGRPSPISIKLSSPTYLSAKSMYIYFSNSDLNITDIQVVLSGSKNNYSSVVLLPAKGSWHLDIQILIDAFTQAQANTDLTIR